MSLDADLLLDRIRLKRQLSNWRIISILAVMMMALFAIYPSIRLVKLSSEHYIARIKIEGIITDDLAQQKMFRQLEEDKNAKAVLVYIDSPGGTAIGGEEIYTGLKRIAAKKPVVVLMRTVAASAGYMASLGGDYVLAREGTLTGSVGVIMQSIEIAELADKIGIKPVVLRSGNLKATPNPMERMTSEQRAAATQVVDSFFEFFRDLVKKERKLDEPTMRKISDGRVFTGRQALELSLIDALGGELEAREWLEKKKNIDPEMAVKDIKPERERLGFFGEMMHLPQTLKSEFNKLPLALDGLLLIWQPSLSQK